ncbi:Ig-like domain-containing protein [Aquipuribacter hungaricus]|uniref:Ig-like domain-containing protein n=2 Tax=Aquipuribacter hungaricus TaxID=545624 RepID=A0ABV7WJW6_9MICO
MPARRRPRAALAAGLAASLLLAPLVVLGGGAPASAAATFAQRFSANTNGSVLIRGNTLMTCASSDAACATAQSSTGGSIQRNNSFAGTFVDVDGDPSTFSSSSAQVTVPAGGSVLYAALVWHARTEGGTLPQDVTKRGEVKLRLPGSSSYTTVVADQLDTLATQSGAYQGYTDVTSQVRAAGSGVYTVADVQASSGVIDRYAGWSLVLAVSDPLAPARNLTVFSGLQSVTGTTPVTIPLEGFVTPPAGAVRTSLGIVASEGDSGATGDVLKLNSTVIGDARNPVDDFFNSSVSEGGTETTGRTPAYNNQLGFDADQVRADGILANGATGATISLTSTGDVYFPGVVTFATELYDPKLLGTKTVTDLDGGQTLPGDVLEYTVPVQNIGIDVASDSTFFDAVPTGTTYVPGSLTVDGTPLTDQAGDDQGSFVTDLNQGHLLVRVGAGATPTKGGEVPADSPPTTYTVRFRAVVDADATDGQELLNAAALTYRGKTTGAAAGSATNAALRTVTAAPLSGGGTKPTATSHIVSFTPRPTSRTLTLDVLADDTDPDSDTLAIAGVTDAAGGSVTVNQDGTLTYSPRDDFAGRDVFTYTVTDGRGGTSTATVQVDVVNTAPVAVADTATTPAGTARVVDVLTNDTDPDGDTRRVRSVSPASARGGQVELLGDGTVRYTPGPVRGTDTFTYVVEDSRGGSDTATVTVTVTNTVPVAVADSYATQAGAPVALAVRANDTDADGDPLTVAVVAGPADGTLGLAPDGTGTYTPRAGFRGTDSFTYRVSDGQGGTSAPVTVTVRVNGAPVADDDAESTPTDQAVTLDVRDGDSDPDGDPLTVTAVTQGAHGAVRVDAAGTVTYTPSTGWAGTDSFTYTLSDGQGASATGTVTVVTDNADPVAVADVRGTGPGVPVTVDVLANDTDPNVTGADPEPSGQELTLSAPVVDDDADGEAAIVDGKVVVTPADGFKGDITVTYTVSDGAGGSDQGTLTVTVSDAAPVAAPDGPVTTGTDASVLVDVLANDVDTNDDPLAVVPETITVPTTADGQERGTAVLEGGKVRYTPPAGFAGTVTFSYTATDEPGSTDPARRSTTVVTVVVANAAPVASPGTATTASGTPVTVDVLADVTDANVPGTDQRLSVTGATATAGAGVVVGTDGRLTVTPAAGHKGAVVVTYTVSDGAGGTATGTLTVTVGDAAPVAGPDTAGTPYATPVSVDLLDDDTDANGDTLSLVPGSVTAPVDGSGTTRGTVEVTGGVARYTPPAGFSGVVTFTYEVTDGDLRTTGTVTVTVGGAPPAVAPETVSVPSTGGPVTIDVLGNDRDPDGGRLTLLSVSQPEHGTVAIVDGQVVYTPEPGYTGVVTFSYTVSDGQGGVSTGTVTLDVVAGPAPTGSPAPGGGAGGGAGSGAGPGTGAGPVVSLPSRLARTGAEAGDVLLGAVVLVALGGGLLVVSRRGGLRTARGRHRA